MFSQWLHREHLNLTYANWKDGRNEGEVDMVLVDNAKFSPMWAAEIKWSNRYVDHPKELKSLLKFCENHQLNKALVTTINQTNTKELNGISLLFIPASVYAYNIGNATLTIKHDSETQFLNLLL